MPSEVSRKTGSSRLATALAVAALLMVTAVAFRGLVLHPGDLLVGPQRGGLNDVTAFWLPSHEYPANELRSGGGYPSWNPYLASGRPFAGHPASAWLYPMTWLFLVLDSWIATSWSLVFHHFWAGLGVFALARVYGLSRAAALAGGFAFLASPYLLAHTGEGHYNHITVVSWYPWAFLALERLGRGTFWAGAALSLTLAVALLAGHLQEWYYLLLAIVFVLVTEAVGRARSSGRTTGLEYLAAAGAALVLSIGLAAVELVPSWVYAQQSIRGFGTEDIGAIGLGLANLRQLLDPLALGGPDAYRGPGLYYWETLAHVGILPLLLALAGVVLGWRHRAVRAFGLLWLVAFAFSFGGGSPVFVVLDRLVPGLGWFRAPARALFVAALAVALLAAFGVDRLGRRLRTPAGRGRPAAALTLLLAALCAAELGLKSGLFLSSIPRSSSRQSPVVEWLSPRAGASRVVAAQHLLSDREALAARIPKVQNYDSVPLAATLAVAQAVTHDRRGGDFLLGFEDIRPVPLRQPLVDLLGARFAVTGAPLESDETPWRLVAEGTMPSEFTLRGRAADELEYFIYENAGALPRAFVLGSVRERRAGESPIEALLSIDPRRELLLERDVLPAGARSGFAPARILEYGADRVVLEARLEEPGYLFLSDTWFPGWTARADDGELDIVRANLAFRAVPLDPGSHRVVFSFRPPGLGPAMLLSLASILGLAYQLRKAWTAAR